MPHLVIEYTNNLRDRFDARVALAELNRELDAVGEFVSEDIKSRARALDTFLVGVSGREEAFIHVELAIMAGRPPELKDGVLKRVLAVVRGHIVAPTDMRMQITVRIVDIDRHGYAKAVVGDAG
jgi:5-carboxymethyl-2-hydroxymuconate isomerase